MIQEELWLSIFDLLPRGLFVIIDLRLSESYGQLRTLSLLRRFGIENFTSTWQALDIVSYYYRVTRYPTPEGGMQDCQELENVLRT